MYVFERRDGTWHEKQKLLPSEVEPSFGLRLAWSGGPAVARGNRYSTAGAFVFEPRDGRWQEEAVLPRDRSLQIEPFGEAVAVDGELIAMVGLLEPTRSHVLLFSAGRGSCNTLHAQPHELSLRRGGTQSLRLNLGRDYAGLPYAVLGTSSKAPGGLPFGGTRLPLGLDGYFQATLCDPLATPLRESFGRLSPRGTADAAFVLPPESGLAALGTRLHHAFVVFDHGRVVHVSNPRQLHLTF